VEVKRVFAGLIPLVLAFTAVTKDLVWFPGDCCACREPVEELIGVTMLVAGFNFPCILPFCGVIRMIRALTLGIGSLVFGALCLALP
jgi:hypothetical protein